MDANVDATPTPVGRLCGRWRCGGDAVGGDAVAMRSVAMQLRCGCDAVAMRWRCGCDAVAMRLRCGSMRLRRYDAVAVVRVSRFEPAEASAKGRKCALVRARVCRLLACCCAEICRSVQESAAKRRLACWRRRQAGIGPGRWSILLGSGLEGRGCAAVSCARARSHLLTHSSVSVEIGVGQSRCVGLGSARAGGVFRNRG